MYFIVKLNIQFGEYLKRSTKLIEAGGVGEAERIAIEREAHGELDWDGDTAYDGIGGELAYSVGSVWEVEPTDLPVLKKYL